MTNYLKYWDKFNYGYNIFITIGTKISYLELSSYLNPLVNYLRQYTVLTTSYSNDKYIIRFCIENDINVNRFDYLSTNNYYNQSKKLPYNIVQSIIFKRKYTRRIDALETVFRERNTNLSVVDLNM